MGKIEQRFRGSEVDPYKFVAEFVKEYGKLPKEDTILSHTGEALVCVSAWKSDPVFGVIGVEN